jgi:hypothetical protein
MQSDPARRGAPGTEGEKQLSVEARRRRLSRRVDAMGRTRQWIVTAAGVGLWAGAPVLGAQTVRLGVVMDKPRQVLADAWTDVARQVERAYCVKDWSYGVYHISKTPPIQDDTVFRVFVVEAAEVSNAGPMSVDFSCPEGQPELHIHTPTTCMGDDVTTCVPGGLNAYSCQPSRGDLEKLVSRRDRFAVLQCDKHAFRFYYPSEYGPPPPTLASQAEPSPGNLTPAMKSTSHLAAPEN